MSGSSSSQRSTSSAFPDGTPIPFYLDALPTGFVLQNLKKDAFLPAIWEAMQPVDGQSYRVDKAWKSDLSPVQNIEAILDLLASVLRPRAVERWNRVYKMFTPLQVPRMAFFDPPRGRCMKIDPEKSRQKRYILQATRDEARARHWGYLRVELYKQDGRTFFLSAHRFVLWAMDGMPEDDSHSLVMHFPCNESACLSRNHLHWGTPAMNRSSIRPMTAAGH